jgi:hypothetical protein
MTRVLEPTKFTALQHELLSIYAFNPSEEDLIEVKDMLAKYFIRKALNKIQDIADEKGITDEDLDKWLEDENQ